MQTRVRLVVSGGIFLLLAVSGVLLRGGLSGRYLADLLALLLAFLIPAQWIASPADVRRQWRLCLAFIVAGTLLWDAASAYLSARRGFLSEWWLVYSSSIVLFAGLLALSGWLVQLLGRRSGVSVGAGRRAD